MIKFARTANGIDFEYKADYGDNAWVLGELESRREVTISNVFYFEPTDLVNSPPKSRTKINEFTYRFRFGTYDGEYVRIPGGKLGVENDVLIAIDMEFKRTLFAAERNISIFGRLASLLDHSSPIVVGGTREDAIPREVFEELQGKFPNTYELDRYADARVSTILSQYLDGMKDARGRYEIYMSKKNSTKNGRKINIDGIKKQEIEKYILIRDVIKDALATKIEMSEAEWQSLMISFLPLLFPKYIKVLENVTIPDYYSVPDRKTARYIDIALVDANGNLDVIEVKKPFEDRILRKSQYRGNNIPTAELSGSIMQAEKYIFHLSKWGVKGEKALTAKYSEQLPKGMTIRVSNPKAIIIVGRDQIGGADMNGNQLLDFEVIKRKYSNMMDIITYDDLLRRLENTIVALGL